jgi:hypothetical protein
MLFVFGPTGVFFEPALQLSITGGYVVDDMMLVDESGESLEHTVKRNGQILTFHIPHFSSYYYDDYDEY